MNEASTSPQLCVVAERGYPPYWRDEESAQMKGGSEIEPFDCPCSASPCVATLLIHGVYVVAAT